MSCGEAPKYARSTHSGHLGGLQLDETWDAESGEQGPTWYHRLLTQWGKKALAVEGKRACQWEDEEGRASQQRRSLLKGHVYYSRVKR